MAINVGKEFFELFNTFTSEEKQSVIDELMTMIMEPAPKKAESCHDIVKEFKSGKPDCPFCKAEAALGCIIKSGVVNGKQRYKCKECGKQFFVTSGTVFSRTRKDAATWRKYIELTLEGKSLIHCARECKLSHQTAFDWRHKFLKSLAENQKRTMMTGIVEMDEMSFAVSCKGNRIKGRFGARSKAEFHKNGLDRDGFKRGTDNKSRKHKDRVTVVCMVEDGDKAFYAAVPGTGTLTNKMLDTTLAAHVNKDTVTVLIDESNFSRAYLKNNNYDFLSLRSNLTDNPHDHKVEVIDGLHIQHVNNFHYHFRRFLKVYCGVSSKYLAHYASLYVWLKNIKANHKNNIQNISLARASYSDCYISGRAIRDYPLIPYCA